MAIKLWNEITQSWDYFSTAGKSAYQSAIDGGYSGTEQKFNEALATVSKDAGGDLYGEYPNPKVIGLSIDTDPLSNPNLFFDYNQIMENNNGRLRYDYLQAGAMNGPQMIFPTDDQDSLALTGSNPEGTSANSNFQLSFGIGNINNTNIYYRTKVSGAYGQWRKLAFSDDVDGLYLPLTGGTLTGTLSSRNIIPSSSGSYTLGSVTNYFKVAYTHTLYVGSVKPSTANGGEVGQLNLPMANIYSSRYYEGGTLLSDKYLQLSGGTLTGTLTTITITPSQTDSWNIGSTSMLYKSVYTSNVVSNFINPISSGAQSSIGTATIPYSLGYFANLYRGGVQVATINDVANAIPNITGSGAITTSNANISLLISSSDKVLTQSTAGLIANLSVESDGNTIRLLGKNGTIIGEFDILQSQVIDNVEIIDGVLKITFIVSDGTETVDIDLSEFISVYEGSTYITVDGQIISLNYTALTNQLITDGFVKSTDLSIYALKTDLNNYVLTTTLTTQLSNYLPIIGGSSNPITGNLHVNGNIWGAGIYPNTSNVGNVGNTTNYWNAIYTSAVYIGGTGDLQIRPISTAIKVLLGTTTVPFQQVHSINAYFRNFEIRNSSSVTVGSITTDSANNIIFSATNWISPGANVVPTLSNTYSLGTLERFYSNIFGTIITTTQVVKPAAGTSGIIGTVAIPWDTGYFTNLYVGGTSILTRLSNYLPLTGGTISGTLTLKGNLVMTDDTYNIGLRSDGLINFTANTTANYNIGYRENLGLAITNGNGIYGVSIVINGTSNLAVTTTTGIFTYNGIEVATVNDLPNLSDYIPKTGNTIATQANTLASVEFEVGHGVHFNGMGSYVNNESVITKTFNGVMNFYDTIGFQFGTNAATTVGFRFQNGIIYLGQGCDILPVVTNTLNLGNANYRFNNIWGNNIYILSNDGSTINIGQVLYNLQQSILVPLDLGLKVAIWNNSTKRVTLDLANAGFTRSKDGQTVTFTHEVTGSSDIPTSIEFTRTNANDLILPNMKWSDFRNENFDNSTGGYDGGTGVILICVMQRKYSDGRMTYNVNYGFYDYDNL